MSTQRLLELARQHGVHLHPEQAEKIERQFVEGELSDMELEAVCGSGQGGGSKKGGASKGGPSGGGSPYWPALTPPLF